MRAPRRSRRAFPTAALALALAGGSALLPACTPEEEETPSPHLLLVSIDTLRRDALRAYDSAAPALPSLDAFAAEAVRFEQAISPAAWTLPAHASMLTGLYPHRHGAVHRLATLAPEVPTLAGALAAAGYETIAYTGGGYLDFEYGLARGFERYDQHSAAGGDAPSWLPRGGSPHPIPARDPFGRAIAHVRHRDDPRPLFLFAHTYALHDYFYDHPWAQPGAPPPDPAVPPRVERSPAMQRNLQCLLGEEACTAADLARLRALYDGELRHVDAALGTLLDAARRHLADRPLWIVVTADHGEGFGGGGPLHHGGRLHPDLLTVPLLVAGPATVPRGVATPVSLVDLAPTLLELAGVEPAAGHRPDSLSLLPLLRDSLRDRWARRTFAHRTMHAEEHYFWWAEGRRRAARDVPERPLQVALMRGGWWYSRGLGREEVVRAAGAPAPRAGEPPRAVVEDLRRAAGEALRARTVGTGAPEVGPDLEKQLESLGYGG